jgi:chemotaxis protein MotA
MIALIGSIIVCACVLGGFMMSGGNLLLLWHPIEIVVIGGAALGAFITSNPIKVVKASVSGAIGLFKKPSYDRAAYVDLLKLIYDLLVKSRKEGLLAIEADIEDPAKSNVFSKYPAVLADHHMLEFITDCLRLMVGGNLDPQELESLLEYELETHHKEAHEPSHAVQGVADALPGFGIVAAVLGIVNTMASLEGAETAEIGAKVGAALVGTFLGILIAYGFVGPIASAMGHRAHEEGKAFEVVKMALVASVRGYPPQVAVEFARKLLFSEVRPTFSDLENHLKGKPPAAPK